MISVEHLWKKKTKIIPVIIGALGAVSGQFKNYVYQLTLLGTNPCGTYFGSQQYLELLQS